ncbi:hypothetical protein [Planctobacterium marinum]|uniref:Uncharacterized protein n=1 Tax=Planctobacterium marinum TaxID=1631968 RepID=A0AA48HN38_9ALTE|nr:hypothetical protein MACH26_33470 [Planctobacterium marinum]
MNRSSKGFGLAGVFITVVVLIVSAVISTTVSSDEYALDTFEKKQAVQSKVN